MITNNELIENNKSFFIKKIVEYNICRTNLIDDLAVEGLFTAPASTMLSLHNAFPGGLIDHLLRVAKYAVQINELLPAGLKSTKESILRVSLLHGIGKVGLYKPCTSDWHIKNQGKMYEFNEDLTSMRIGERSVFYLMNHGNGDMLTDVEYQAIINHDKNVNDDSMVKWHTNILGVVLRQAIELAIMEEKGKIK
jgi:hypothetical protein